MMTATGKVQALEISRNGAPITMLHHRKGPFTLDGQSYLVHASGTRNYELHRGDEVLAFAKTSLLKQTTVTHGDKSWLLNVENFLGTRYGLYDGATRVGGISAVGGMPGSWFRPWKGATIDLPDALPIEAQLFLLTIVLFKWDEANNSGPG